MVLWIIGDDGIWCRDAPWPFKSARDEVLAQMCRLVCPINLIVFFFVILAHNQGKIKHFSLFSFFFTFFLFL